MFDTLFLDLDGVVLNFKFAERAAISETLGAAGCFDADAAETFSRINDGLWKAHERGEIDKARLKVERFRQIVELYRLHADPAELSDGYVAALSRQGQLEAGALGALKFLKGKFKLYAVSNGTTKVQRGRLKAAGIDKFFNGIFLSEEIGFVKPDPQFFEKCLTLAHADRTRVLVVGDSPTADMAGAIGAGLKCCYIGSDEIDLPVDFCFDSLKSFSTAVEEGSITGGVPWND